jgi:hypothetical protein
MVGWFSIVMVFTPDVACEVLCNVDLARHTMLDMWYAEGHAANSIIFFPAHNRRQVQQHGAVH